MLGMRSDLLERVHHLPLESDERRQVLDLFGCFSLATVVLRMQKMPGEDRAKLEHQIEHILESGATPEAAPEGS
jgi:hypothetical protein